MSKWPEWMNLPWEFWSDKELNMWLRMYHQYVETQRLKEIMKKEK